MEDARVRPIRPELDAAAETSSQQSAPGGGQAYPDAETAAYWESMRALRAERDRLRRAG